MTYPLQGVHWGHQRWGREHPQLSIGAGSLPSGLVAASAAFILVSDSPLLSSSALASSEAGTK